MSDSPEKKIIDIIGRYAPMGGQQITLDTPLQGIGLDSLLMVEIIFDLEERFDISIPDPEFVQGQKRQFETVADVVRSVTGLIEEQRKAQ